MTRDGVAPGGPPQVRPTQVSCAPRGPSRRSGGGPGSAPPGLRFRPRWPPPSLASCCRSYQGMYIPAGGARVLWAYPQPRSASLKLTVSYLGGLWEGGWY